VINRAQVQGDEAGEEFVTGSVVYLGRDSFRMETVVETFDDDGAPREVTGIVTSPYRTRTEIPANDAAQIANALLPLSIDEDATEIIARARAGQWRADAPSLPDPLFGSQTDVPLLSAPTERLLAPRGRVALSRGTLVAAGLLLFASGLASVAVARRATSLTATVPAKQPPAAAPIETVAVVPTETAPTITPLMVDLPEPVLVRVHKKTAAVSSSRVARHAAPEVVARWVDPFAD
jgi:hypothetical protein